MSGGTWLSGEPEMLRLGEGSAVTCQKDKDSEEEAVLCTLSHLCCAWDLQLRGHTTRKHFFEAVPDI